jgi:hypothetical protein
MAGYLIHHDDLPVASVLYCELHPQFDDQAKLLLYENELCQTPVMDIYISERSICCEKVGINCSCFCVEDHQFSTRTLSERKLWLRAISNVKVKLQNRAPTPSCEDLKHDRLAIKEHISTIKATLEGQAPMDALLQRNPRKSYHTPGGLDGGVGPFFPEKIQLLQQPQAQDDSAEGDAAKTVNESVNGIANGQVTDSQPEAPPQDVIVGNDANDGSQDQPLTEAV